MANFEEEDMINGNMWNPDVYVAAGLLPDQNFDNIKAAPHERNDSLLVLANTAVIPGARTTKVNPKIGTPPAIFNYLHTIEDMSGFHTKGLVRLLLWASDKEKLMVIPRCLYQRKLMGVFTELLTYTEEIAGGTLDSGRQRDEEIEYRSCMNVAASMKKQGIHIATNRLANLPREIQETRMKNPNNFNNSDPPLSNDASQRDWHQELLELERGLINGRYTMFVGGAPGLFKLKQGPPPKPDRGKERTPEFNRYSALLVTRDAQRRLTNKLQVLAKEKEEIVALENLARKESNLAEDNRQEKLQEIYERDKLFKSKLERLRWQDNVKLQDTLDNRRAFLNHPPILLWDQRTAEPIIAQDDEFYPHKPAALLDFQPRPLVMPKTPSEKAYLDQMIQGLFVVPSQSIVSALNNMALGAADALIPHAPTLRDPEQGGAYDLEELRVRLLTTKMLNELMLAWEKWPFRPHPTEFDPGIEKLFESVPRL